MKEVPDLGHDFAIVGDLPQLDGAYSAMAIFLFVARLELADGDALPLLRELHESADPQSSKK